MKKTRLLLLITLTLICLCAGAQAAGPNNPVYMGEVTDVYGNTIAALTDGDIATTWTQSGPSYGADLTIQLYNATVGEIWVRNGHCYSQNYYDHYDRPDVIAVTLLYNANRYTESSVTYRYRMSDAFRPSANTTAWYSGYQRMLLPQQVTGVTRIEMTIESATQGFGYTGATITDILVASGSHATATPYTRVTATPRPNVQYITPSPTPYIHIVTPTPTRNVEYITPVPTRDVVILTPEPTISLLTPTPDPYEELIFPSEGVVAPLLKTAATRSGPSNDYDEPGSFFSKGTKVNVVSKAWDSENGLWWFQIEFSYRGEWMRAYTPSNRVDLNPSSVPTENDDGDAREVLYDQRVYFGPGTSFKMYKVSMLYKESRAVIYGYEEVNGELWAQIHYHDYAVGEDRRGWVPAACLSSWPFPW